jgi:hypothetical protein
VELSVARGATFPHPGPSLNNDHGQGPARAGPPGHLVEMLLGNSIEPSPFASCLLANYGGIAFIILFCYERGHTSANCFSSFCFFFATKGYIFVFILVCHILLNSFWLGESAFFVPDVNPFLL